jgi:hypothetical protein
MVPDQVTYDPATEAMAKRYRDCAARFVQNNFSGSVPGCKMTPLGRPF